MPVKALAPEAMKATRLNLKPTVTERMNTVSKVADRLGMRFLTNAHKDAIVNSGSLNRHSFAALQCVEKHGMIEPNSKLGPLTELGSLDIFSVMGAGFTLAERGIPAENIELYMAELAKLLDRFEGIRAKGLLSGNANGYLPWMTPTSISINSPSMTSLSKMAYEARNRGYAIPACNVNNEEMVEAALAAAAVMRAPIILEWSPGANKYHGNAVAASVLTRMLANVTIAAGLPVPVCCHLDHGTTSAVREAIEAGFTSVMYDATEAGSLKEIPSFEQTVIKTAELTRIAHDREVAMEGEVGGPVNSFQDLSMLSPADRRKFLTEPAMAVDFVGRTSVDLLAVSVGTVHGAIKYKGTPFIDMERLAEIRAALDNAGFSNVGLVFHGGSDNSPFMDEIVRLTGKPYTKSPSGTPISLQQQAIKQGSVVKINLDTIFRNAQAYAVLLMREKMAGYIADKAKDDFREHIGTPWRIALMLETMRKLVELGAAGHAADFGWSATDAVKESKAGKAIE